MTASVFAARRDWLRPARAPPRRGWRADRIAEQLEQRRSSSLADRTWTAAPLSRNVREISAKFCMCGPKTIGFPKTAGSRICGRRHRRGCRRRTPRSRSGTLRQLADRVEDDDVVRAARRRRAAPCAAPRASRAAREPLGLDEALRLPRRDDEQRIAPGGADPLERLEDRLLFSLNVLRR